MHFAIHNKDSGEITQAIRTYVGAKETKEYEQRVKDMGYDFIKDGRDGLVTPEIAYVHTGKKAIVARPPMPIVISKTTVRAGSYDAAILNGIPKQARLTIEGAGATIHDFNPFGEDQLELYIPVPMTYTITCILFPYRHFVARIEAIA